MLIMGCMVVGLAQKGNGRRNLGWEIIRLLYLVCRQNGQRCVFVRKPVIFIGAEVLRVEGILLCFLLLWGELSGLVRFFMGIGLNLCCAIVGGIVLSKWDGKIWRLLVFEIELLRCRIA